MVDASVVHIKNLMLLVLLIIFNNKLMHALMCQ